MSRRGPDAPAQAGRPIIGMIPRAQGPKAPMTRRTRGREIALQVLYQLSRTPAWGRRRFAGSSGGGSATRSSASSPGPVAGRPGAPAPDRRADLRGRRKLAARPDGRHRPQHPAARRLRIALLPRRAHQGRHQRGPRTGQALQHGPVEPVRQRHPRPPPGRRDRRRRQRSRKKSKIPAPRPNRDAAARRPPKRTGLPYEPRVPSNLSAPKASRPGPPSTAGPTRPSAADLHVHTTHSDGGCSPGEVVSGRPTSDCRPGDHRP